MNAKDTVELVKGVSVPARTPPIFLVHGDDDIISDPQGSVLMYLALKRAGVPAEVHIYAHTTHDFGVRQVNRSYASWTESCANWMQEHGFLEGGTAAASPDR